MLLPGRVQRGERVLPAPDDDHPHEHGDACDRQQRDVEAGQVVPHGLQGPLARRAQQRRQVGRRVRKAAGALRLDQGLRLVGEERLALPHGNDVLDARSLHPRRELGVRLHTGGSLGAVLEAGRRTDRDETGVSARRPQHGSEGEPATERVADRDRAVVRGDLRKAPLEVVLAMVHEHARIALL